MFRCGRWDGDEWVEHHFTVLDKPASSDARALLDAAVAPPECPTHGRDGRYIWAHGTYTTMAGERQRYRCVDAANTTEGHNFSAPLPRAAVDEDTCCPDCENLTPRHAGSESASRRLNIPAPVVAAVLRDLADGHAYTTASRRALETMNRPTGRVRKVKGVEPAELNKAGAFGPDRELKAHWHLSADILERFGPFVTEPAFEEVRAEEVRYRQLCLPVVYFADEVQVKRDFARSTTLTTSPVVWTALVVTRTRWVLDDAGQVVGRSNRLVRVRALPNATTEAWRLVLSELDAPTFLVADGAAAIEKAASLVWGKRTQFVPCIYHATRNITENLAPGKQRLPEKVRDHLFRLSRDLMRDGGAAAVTDWFDELAELAGAAGMPADLVAGQRTRYLPLLKRTAAVAAKHNDPEVQVSNSAVEADIRAWVKGITNRRGAMFTNLARTNLLGDLVVAASNGALRDPQALARTVRHASRTTDGWAPPPRAMTEPLGVLGLRDTFSVLELLERETT